jgi:uncharacterized RDD family membrane protein YckC
VTGDGGRAGAAGSDLRAPHTPRLHGGPAIVTPDAVGLDVEVATVGSRGVAYVIDLLAFLTVFVVLSFAQLLLGGAGFVPGWFAIAVLLLLTFAWQFGYPIGFETLWRGRTPGKAALGLRVVTLEGAPVGVRHASVRAVVGLLELLGTFGIPAILTSMISSRSQRLGDLAAGTMVVRERRASRTPQVEVFTPPPGLEHYVAQLDVAGLRPADYATIRETLRRAGELPPEVGHRVTAELAHQLLPRVRPAPPAGCEPWVFLRCVAAAVQARRAPAPGGGPTGATSGAGSLGSGTPSSATVAAPRPPAAPQSPSPPAATPAPPPAAQARPPAASPGPSGRETGWTETSPSGTRATEPDEGPGDTGFRPPS